MIPKEKFLALIAQSSRDELLGMRKLIDEQIRKQPAKVFEPEKQRKEAIAAWRTLIAALKQAIKAAKNGTYIADAIVETYVSDFNIRFRGNVQQQINTTGVVMMEDLGNVIHGKNIAGVQLILYSEPEGHAIVSVYTRPFK